MAKEGIPFAKYPALLHLEQHHAVDVGHAYHTTNSAKQFTTYIARSQRQEFLNALPKDSFFSLLMDGTTDVAVVEDEVIVIVYCNIDDVDEEITSTSRFCLSMSCKKLMLMASWHVFVMLCTLWK